MFTLLLLLTGSASAQAMPLDEYKARISTVMVEIAGASEPVKAETAEEHSERLRRAFNSARRAVPTDEIIEWEGGRTHVNNSWLEEELKSFSQLSPADPRGPIILARVIERLGALQDRLSELERSDKTAAATLSKDQEKARLEAIMRREEFVEKTPQKNIFQRAWERFKEWLNNLFPGSSLEPGRMSWLSFIAMILIFGLAGLLLGYAIWKLIPLLQRRRGKVEPRRARVVLGERLAPDQTAADLLQEAESLARRGEMRAAIRKAYIALLCELGDRKVLTLAQHKTNRDYLRAMRERRPLLDEMQKLTNSYENHWYGFGQTTPDDWIAFRSGYEKVIGDG